MVRSHTVQHRRCGHHDRRRRQGHVSEPRGRIANGVELDTGQGEPLERVFRIINEYTRQTVDNPIGKVLQTGNIVGLANHTALINKNGRVIPIEDNAGPIRDTQGKVVGAVMVFHDVSDRRRVEEALRTSEERLRATFNQAAVGIIVADMNGRFLEANPRVCDILGYSFDQLQRLTFTQTIHPEDLSETQAQMRILLAGEIPHCSLRDALYPQGRGRYLGSHETHARRCGVSLAAFHFENSVGLRSIFVSRLNHTA